MLTLGEARWVEVYGNSLYYLSNATVNPKLFQNKKFVKNIVTLPQLDVFL